MATKSKDTAAEGFIRLALAAPFQAYLLGRNCDPGPTLLRHGLSAEALSDPAFYVHADVMYRLIEGWARDAGDPYLGLHVGEAFNLLEWPPVISSAADADTLGAFLANFVSRVPKETNAVTHALVIDMDGAHYRVARQVATTVPQHQNIGFGCAVYVRLLMSATGPFWEPDKVCLFARDLKGVPPRYLGIQTRQSPDQSFALRFPAEWLFRKLHLVPRPVRHAGTMPETDVSMVVALGAILRARLDEPRFDPQEIADLLGMTPSRLKTALAKEGTTLPREIKRLRIARARELLREGQLTVTQIGLAVGYVDKAHFTRFFRSQTGITPSVYREQARP